jgi:hypothetical protein
VASGTLNMEHGTLSSSPTSVVEKSVIQSCIPNHPKIEAQLKSIAKQLASSNIFYQAKLEKVTHDLKGSNDMIEVLLQMLAEAKAKRAENQKCIKEVKNK